MYKELIKKNIEEIKKENLKIEKQENLFDEIDKENYIMSRILQKRANKR